MHRGMVAISALALAFSVLGAVVARAQVVTDGSVGPQVSLSGTAIDIGHELGTTRGTNLFHSFREFNVNAGQTVTFTGPPADRAPITNVIGRVTGGHASAIDGTLRSTVQQADVWLVNPSGVVFGPDARLDVPAAFHASTADEVRLSDGGRFSAGDPVADVLTVAPPEAFGFHGSGPVGDITVSGSRLQAAENAALSLSGRDVIIRDGAHVSAPGGSIGIVAVGRPRSEGGTLVKPPGRKPGGGGMTVAGDAPSGTVSVRSGLIGLDDFERVRRLQPSSGVSDGPIDIRGGTVAVDDGSAVLTRNVTDGATSGAITVVGDRVRVGAGSEIITTALAGDAASVIIDAGALVVDGGATASAPYVWRGTTRTAGDRWTGGRQAIVGSSAGDGDSGDIHIRAPTVELVGGGTIVVISGRDNVAASSGSVGTIDMAADRIDVYDQGEIRSENYGVGGIGVVRLHAGEILVHDGGEITTTADFLGRCADIRISADTLRLFRSAHLTSDNNGSLAGGDIRITARAVEIDQGQLATASSSTLGADRSAAIDIATDTLSLRAGTVRATSVGGGGTGPITIDARQSIDIAYGGEISTAAAASSGDGRAGDIRVSTKRLTIDGQGFVADTFFTQGFSGRPAAALAGGVSGARTGIFSDTTFLSALAETLLTTSAPLGTVSIAASESVDLFDGGGIGTSAGKAIGGGSIEIDTPALRLRGGAISSDSTASGDAGAISIRASSVTLDGGATISTDIASAAGGAGGAITVTTGAGGLSIRGDGSAISSDNAGGRDGGRILLGGSSVTLSDGGSITARSEGAGPAGDIDLTARKVTIRGSSAITTESATAGGGGITLNAGEYLLISGGRITSETRGGAGDAGDIAVSSPSVAMNAGAIRANADAGNGGNITISSARFLTSSGATVEASSRLGVSGNIVIEAPPGDTGETPAILPLDRSDASDLDRPGCIVAGTAAASIAEKGRLARPAAGAGPARGHLDLARYLAAYDADPAVGPDPGRIASACR